MIAMRLRPGLLPNYLFLSVCGFVQCINDFFRTAGLLCACGHCDSFRFRSVLSITDCYEEFTAEPAHSLSVSKNRFHNLQQPKKNAGHDLATQAELTATLTTHDLLATIELPRKIS